MRQTIILYILLFLASGSLLNAQNYNLPPNPEGGKCYIRCFEFDKAFKWEEIDCSKAKKLSEKRIPNKDTLSIYQSELVSLGYDVDINGTVDNKTIIAHHKYLKQKRKALKKEKKRLRQLKKSKK